MDGQMNIFDFIKPEIKEVDLESFPEEEMVQHIKSATGIPFTYRDDLTGYEAKIKKMRYTVKYSRYWDGNKRFISCGYGNNIGGSRSPCDSIEEAIAFFKRGLNR